MIQGPFHDVYSGGDCSLFEKNNDGREVRLICDCSLTPLVGCTQKPGEALRPIEDDTTALNAEIRLEEVPLPEQRTNG